MATSHSSDARELITLAERMGIPSDEAMRQVALLIADEAPTERLPAPAIAGVVAGTASVA